MAGFKPGSYGDLIFEQFLLSSFPRVSSVDTFQRHQWDKKLAKFGKFSQIFYLIKLSIFDLSLLDLYVIFSGQWYKAFSWKCIKLSFWFQAKSLKTTIFEPIY